MADRRHRDGDGGRAVRRRRGLRETPPDLSLVLTADDFGLSTGVNEAVEQAHRAGVLTHASLMVAGPAAADAVSRARRLPGLGVGLHLVAVEGPAVLPPGTIPALVGADGWFPSDQLRLGVRYALRADARRQLAAEVEAQFAAFAATGLELSHADAHKHMHLHPYVGRLLLDAGRRHGLTRVRVPREPPGVMRGLGEPVCPGARALDAWAGVLRGQVRAAGMVSPEAVFGLAWSGRFDEARLLRLLAALRPGDDAELYFHPATHRDALLRRLMPEYQHESELAALTSEAVRRAVQAVSVAGRARRSM